MFARLVYQSFLRQRRRKLLAGAAIALGMAVTTAMIAVASDIGDKMGRELRTYGANIAVYPQQDTLDLSVGGVDLKPASEGAYLNEDDLKKIKGIFWRNNIVGYAPFLPLRAKVADTAGATSTVDVIGTYFARRLQLGKESFVTGVQTTHPWWKVEGSWPADDSAGVLIGERLAVASGWHVGDQLRIDGRPVRVTGILRAGSDEANAIVVPLSLAQQLAGHPGAVRRVLVSALTKPEDAFARRDPASMTPADRDRWYCSPYANSISYQLREAIPGAAAGQIRQVAQNEGIVLSRIQGLMLLITLAALLASTLAVAAAMATAILERRTEVGLMKAVGAANSRIAAIFLTEAALLALLGGIAGFGVGALLAQGIGRTIFDSAIAIQPVLFPVVLLLAVLVTWAASAASIRNATRFDAAVVLRGDA